MVGGGQRHVDALDFAAQFEADVELAGGHGQVVQRARQRRRPPRAARRLRLPRLGHAARGRAALDGVEDAQAINRYILAVDAPVPAPGVPVAPMGVFCVLRWPAPCAAFPCTGWAPPTTWPGRRCSSRPARPKALRRRFPRRPLPRPAPALRRATRPRSSGVPDTAVRVDRNTALATNRQAADGRAQTGRYGHWQNWLA